MTDRDDRSDRLRRRFDRDGPDADHTSTPAREDGSEDDSETEDKSSSHDDSSSVKDRPSVLMYLPEDTRQELDIRFDELNAQYKRAHGEPLEKNRDYYPAVIQAGLEGRDVEDILEL